MKSLSFSTSGEEIVITEEHFFNLKWKCHGQPFPAIGGNMGFEMPHCNLSDLRASDVLHFLPQEIMNFPTPTIMDVARLISIWTSTESVSEKVYRVLNPGHKTLSLTGLRCALSFFRSRCSHHAWLYKCYPRTTVLTHPNLPDFPVPIRDMFAEAWKGSFFDWNNEDRPNSDLVARMRVLAVVPYQFEPLKAMSTGEVFVYKLIHEWNNALVHQESVGAIVVVLPVVCPTYPYEFLTGFDSVAVRWLEGGIRVFVLPPPRGKDTTTWYNVCREASHRIADLMVKRSDCQHLLRQYLPAESPLETGREPCQLLGEFTIYGPYQKFSEIQCRTAYEAWNKQLDAELKLPLLKHEGSRYEIYSCIHIFTIS